MTPEKINSVEKKNTKESLNEAQKNAIIDLHNICDVKGLKQISNKDCNEIGNSDLKFAYARGSYNLGKHELEKGAYEGYKQDISGPLAYANDKFIVYLDRKNPSIAIVQERQKIGYNEKFTLPKEKRINIANEKRADPIGKILEKGYIAQNINKTEDYLAQVDQIEQQDTTDADQLLLSLDTQVA